MIKVTTQRDTIRNVAEKWRRQYLHGDAWTETRSGSSLLIYERLCALDRETATREDVKAVIGNDSWTRLECNACNQTVDAIVTVGEESDYESRTASLCRACATRAAIEISNTPPTGGRDEC